MAQHSSLTDPELHEPKGAAAANNREVYVANGAGSGTWKKQVYYLQVSITPAAVLANNTSEQAFTFSGVDASHICIGVSKPTHQAGLGVVGWRVSAANTLAITWMNTTVGNITPTAEIYTAVFYAP